MSRHQVPAPGTLVYTPRNAATVPYHKRWRERLTDNHDFKLKVRRQAKRLMRSVEK